MTSQVVNTTSELIAKLQTLPPEQQQQVLDFVEFLAQKYVQPQAPKKRVMGLHKGQIWMSEDFNDPLPDEFWMGEGVV
ncbi:type II toxin-antitoxin system VapB family antitoxin [Tolypothrix sp. VBCCA 56010]|uniref:type II toxin-antitoxin system VapB family antitoxin n=1 Tax=Tolypothrix sp. VBCCA 56010 TaxID=3137731 RepID=UPI003D7D3B03